MPSQFDFRLLRAPHRHDLMATSFDQFLQRSPTFCVIFDKQYLHPWQLIPQNPSAKSERQFVDQNHLSRIAANDLTLFRGQSESGFFLDASTEQRLAFLR